MKLTGDEPANPVMHADGTFKGLTIRQRFAESAMRGLLANSEMARYFLQSELSIVQQRRYTAEVSCGMADALIEELNKQPVNP